MAGLQVTDLAEVWNEVTGDPELLSDEGWLNRVEGLLLVLGQATAALEGTAARNLEGMATMNAALATQLRTVCRLMARRMDQGDLAGLSAMRSDIEGLLGALHLALRTVEAQS